MRRLLLASSVTSAEFSELCAFMMMSPVSRDRRDLTDKISPSYELIVDSGSEILLITLNMMSVNIVSRLQMVPE